MIRALYTATSGMMVEARRLDLTSQNLYFAQTPGFKAARVLRAAEVATDPTLPADVQTTLGGQFVDPSPGPLRTTGKPLDLALEGDGFFAVRTTGGVAYTRDGRFHRGGDGGVMTVRGDRLLGEGGPIRFPEDAPPDAPVEVETDGTLRVSGKVIDRMQIQDFPGYRGLQAAGGSLYYPTGATAPQPAAGAMVRQGTLEDANSSTVTEMTTTIETLRAFESYQKVIQTVMDDLTGEAVRRLGRVA